MAVVVVVLMLGWLVVRLATARRRPRPRAGAAGRPPDAPAVLLGWATRLLAPDRADWGRAMVGELAQLHGRPRRWRFVLGCVVATPLFFPARRGQPERLIVAAVLAAVAGCIGLAAYGLVHYPGLRAGRGTWPSVAIFLVLLAGYTATTLMIAGRGAPPTRAGARAGLATGLAAAGLWVLVGLAATALTGWRTGPLMLLALPLAAVAAAATATRRGSTVAGRQAALLTAVAAGLLTFLVWTGVTLATAGRPYDPGMIRDFTTSGSPDLATYAVNDNLGAAMMLLLLVPALTATLGYAAATVTARLRPAR